MIHFSSVEMCKQAKFSNIHDDLVHSTAHHVTSATKKQRSKSSCIPFDQVKDMNMLHNTIKTN